MPKSSNTVARLVDHSAPEAEPPPASSRTSRAPFVAECIDARHPALAGRVRVRWASPEGSVEQWVPTLLSS